MSPGYLGLWKSLSKLETTYIHKQYCKEKHPAKKKNNLSKNSSKHTATKWLCWQEFAERTITANISKKTKKTQ